MSSEEDDGTVSIAELNAILGLSQHKDALSFSSANESTNRNDGGDDDDDMMRILNDTAKNREQTTKSMDHESSLLDVVGTDLCARADHFVELHDFGIDHIEVVYHQPTEVHTPGGIAIPGQQQNYEDQQSNSQVFHGNLQDDRKRRKKAQPQEWKRNKNAKLRSNGEEYLGFQTVMKQTDGATLTKKTVQKKLRPARKVGSRCKSLACRKNSTTQCQIIPDDLRMQIFERFWKLDWGQKKVYVCSLVDYIEVKRRAPQGSRRHGTYVYHLKDNRDHKLKVCKGMFLSTLSISEKQVRNWISKSASGIPVPSPKISSGNQRLPLVRFLKDFFKLLPKMPSHYCRASSTKLYLEPIYNSTTHLYEIYREKCLESNVKALSRHKFDQIYTELNLSVFTNKKDQCDLCCSHRVGNFSQEDWTLHQAKKADARVEKDKDKTNALNGDCYTICMDVESVKVSPCLKASAIYYKTKLCAHNFTIYNMSNHKATCYWWNETEADLQASTFASCLVDYVCEQCTDITLPLIIYSYGCTNQNRNAVMSNALLHLAMDTNRCIVQKFLEKGHTQMECDSVHSVIETRLKNKDIHLPSDYVRICKEARKLPCPYDVKELTHEFFRDFSRKESMRYVSIRPGKKAGDAVLVNLKQIKYEPSGTIYYKLDHKHEEWNELPIRPRNIQQKLFPKLFTTRLTVTERKCKDLQELKAILPSDCHSFYDQIPH